MSTCQIYLLTPPKIDDLNGFVKALENVLAAAPIACLQIRLKDTPKESIIRTARKLIPIAHQYGTDIIINDDPHIALETGADGVHLGQSDMDIKLAKKLLPKDAIIGVTCHNSRDHAFKAGSDGASYVGFGAFFASQTKPGALAADLETLSWWKEATIIPSVAIGGITPENALPLIQAGADYLALSSGIWDYKHGPVKAVLRLHALCSSASQGSASSPRQS